MVLFNLDKPQEFQNECIRLKSELDFSSMKGKWQAHHYLIGLKGEGGRITTYQQAKSAADDLGVCYCEIDMTTLFNLRETMELIATDLQNSEKD